MLNISGKICTAMGHMVDNMNLIQIMNDIYSAMMGHLYISAETLNG